MTESSQSISPLRQRMIDGMTMRKLSAKTQAAYLRAVKNFTRLFRRAPDLAAPEDLRILQLHLVEQGVSSTTLNATSTGLKFFFGVTVERPGRVETALPGAAQCRGEMDATANRLASSQGTICDTLRRPLRGSRLMNRLTHKYSDSPFSPGPYTSCLVIRSCVPRRYAPRGGSSQQADERESDTNVDRCFHRADRDITLLTNFLADVDAGKENETQCDG